MPLLTIDNPEEAEAILMKAHAVRRLREWQVAYDFLRVAIKEIQARAGSDPKVALPVLTRNLDYIACESRTIIGIMPKDLGRVRDRIDTVQAVTSTKPNKSSGVLSSIVNISSRGAARLGLDFISSELFGGGIKSIQEFVASNP